MLKTPSPPGTTTRNTHGNFYPAPRGDIQEALEKSGQLMKVAPESPRPAEMMEGVFITGKDSLTADDAALHDLLVSKAYEIDNSMSTTTYALDVRQAMNFLGTVHRDLMGKALRRLASTTVSYGTLSTRRYEDVPLLVSWLESTKVAVTVIQLRHQVRQKTLFHFAVRKRAVCRTGERYPCCQFVRCHGDSRLV